ncbi:G-protein coupled receptor 21 [Biomphalaria pfeifferi]|uniref:G-protein coupled receptor 21 n=1 Tax=Biomphalaria pfeifferi TaxID=112525 RepID=A0AAD8C3G1_BIOPF|nr:G-protein coupled receptor 21 [Biomphalaria pfeifferi]
MSGIRRTMAIGYILVMTCVAASQAVKDSQEAEVHIIVSSSSTASPFLEVPNKPSADSDDPEFTLQTFLTMMVTLLIVLTNCAIIMVASWTDSFVNFNKTFIYSLTLADLLIGLFITPYSIFLSVYRKWVFTSEMFCSVEAYVFTTLMTAKMYSLTWLNVDHYVAVRKPERYNVMMSSTRSLCWIVFSWIVAVSFCCPPLFSFQSAVFNKATSICMIDTKQQVAYMLTAGVLVSIPSLFAMGVTSAYLFTSSFKKRLQFYEKVYVELCSRPRNYHITCIMCLAFTIAWFPFVIINLVVKQAFQTQVNDFLQFFACWLGISTSFSQFFILIIWSADFRLHFLEVCQLPSWCKPCNRQSDTDSRDINIITIPKKR